MDLYIDDEINKPKITITDTAAEKSDYYKNTGDLGGGFVIKVTGPSYKVKKYNEELKIFGLKASSNKTEKVDQWLSRRDKIIERDRKIREDRRKKNMEILKRDAEIRRKKLIAKKKQIERDANIRIDRIKRKESIIERDRIIRAIREERKEKINRINNEMIASQKPPVKLGLDKYNPKTDLLIEISLIDMKAQSGFFIMSFDPTIRKGDKHFYRPTRLDSYKAHINTERGKVLFRMIQRNNKHLLAEKTLKVGKDVISFEQNGRNIVADLVVTSVENVSSYAGVIHGWYRNK